MASLASLEAARGQIVDQLSTISALLVGDRRELARQETNLQFATTAQQKTAIQGTITTLKAQIAQNTQEERRLTQELADIDQQIAVAQAQQGPRTSAGETVAQAQRANDDRADTVSPGAPPAVTAGATNADQFQVDQAADTGTDAQTRPTTVTQSIPPTTARPGAARQTITPPNNPGQITVDPFGGFGDDAAVNATSRSGTATNEDGIANSNPTRAALNQIFAGKINPQSNVLDQYASYTYSISIYLMNADDYKALIQNPNALPKGAQLILQSGGAPIAGGALPDVQEAQQAADGNGAPLVLPELGRNPNFPLDYYLDDVRLTSYILGKATGMAHNVFEVKFKVIEPNGITFLDNLYKATDQYVQLSGTPQVNYAAQNYLMVVRFYGYDKDGNLVTAQNQTTDFFNVEKKVTESRSVSIEKFIPFQFTKIRFRVANKMVEYDCEGVAVHNNVAMGIARGTIPYNVELTSQSLVSLLQGKQKFSSSGDDNGRPLSSIPDQTDAETARLNRQNAAAARSGVTQANISAATWAARQEAAAAKVQQARREQLGLVDPAAPAPVTAGTGPTQNQAPPKASAQNTKTLVTGLADALDRAQDEWVAKGTYTYPDRYFFELDPVLAEAKVVPPGSTNLRMTPMGANETVRNKLPETQAVDSNAKKFSILAGTSVVQFLDQVVRNSTYIYDQQIKYYDPKTNALVDVGKPANITGWYKISMQAVPQDADKYDPKRNDYAYNITYKVEVYGINDAKSPFFPGTLYRGTHKVYDYWFTGVNTQVLDFQQDFNYLYYIVQNSRAPDRTRLTTNYREVPKLVAQPRSDQSDQMNEGSVGEPSAQLADYLYSPGDTARVKLKIVGDPAWIQQGDVRGGLVRGSQLYDSFLPDGTINYNGQEVLFEILWNKPVDYDLSTGLMDTGAKNYNANRKAGLPGQAVQTNVYKAISVISNFTQGRFEQELEGVQVYYELPQPKQQQQEKQEKKVQAKAKATNYRNPLVNIPAASPGLFELETGTGSGEVNYKPTSLATVLDSQKQTKSTAATQEARDANPAAAPTSTTQTIGAPGASVPLQATGGATGRDVGSPPTVNVYLKNGGVAQVSTQAEINALYSSGKADSQAASSATNRLRIWQTAANNPTSSARPQKMAKES